MRFRSTLGTVLGAVLTISVGVVAAPASAAPPPAATTGKAGPPAAAATPFDTGFGTGGVVSNAGTALSYGADVTGLADGSIVLAGSAISHAGSAPSVEFGLIKRLPNGTLDPAFGSGGTAVVEAGQINPDSGPTPMAVQADGKIVVGTETSSFAGNQRWVLARTLPNGAADPSFSGDGRLQVSFPTDFLYAYLTDVLLRPDGRIVAIGFTRGLLLVAQFLPDGSFEGLAGFALVDSGLGYDMAWALDLDAQGRVLLAGRIPGPLPQSQPHSGTGEQTGVVRLLPNGSLDPSFGVNGRVTLAFDGPAQFNHANGVQVLPDGRIAVLSEYSPDYSSVEHFVAVLSDSGQLDPTFDGGDGIAQPLSEGFVGGSLVLLPTGKLLVYNLSALVRLNTVTETTDLALTLGADQVQAGPGPLTFTATVRNDGPVAATVSLNLNVSKAASVAGSTRMTCYLDKIAVNVGCKPVSVPVGGTVSVSVATTVDGYEGSVTLSGTVTSSTPDLDMADNSALVEVLTSTEHTM